MKIQNIKQSAITVCVIVALGLLVSGCQKDNIATTNDLTSLSNTEINFEVKKEEVHDKVINFINHTKFSSATSKTTFEDIQLQDGAWTFEAAANYLEYSNLVDLISETVSSTIIVPLNGAIIPGQDLTNEFDVFMTDMEQHGISNGTVPKFINIQLGIVTSSTVELLADVSFGEETIGAFNFPTTDVNPYLAAQILTASVSSEYNVVQMGNGQTAVANIYPYSVNRISSPIPPDFNSNSPNYDKLFHWTSSSNMFPHVKFQHYNDGAKDLVQQAIGGSTLQVIWVDIYANAVGNSGIHQIHNIFEGQYATF